MLLIPEQKLKSVIDYCLKYLRNDYNDTTDKSQTYLYALFGEMRSDFDYYNNAVALLNRRSDHPRSIETHFFLNRERFAPPTIHITLSGNNDGPNGLGFDKDFNFNLYNPETETVLFKHTGSRAFNTRFQIVFTCDNTFEVLIMYYVIKACLIGNIHLLEMNGIRNPSLKGADIILQDHLAPPNIYSRALMIDCFFEITAPSFDKNRYITDINFEGKVIP